MKNLLSTVTLTMITGAASVIGLCLGATLWETKIESWVNKKLN